MARKEEVGGKDRRRRSVDAGAPPRIVRIGDDGEARAREPGVEHHAIGIARVDDAHALAVRATAERRAHPAIVGRFHCDRGGQVEGLGVGGQRPEVGETLAGRLLVGDVENLVNQAYARQRSAVLVDRDPLVGVRDGHLGVAVEERGGGAATCEDEVPDRPEVEERRPPYGDTFARSPS
jgi:hypothetical protein